MRGFLFFGVFFKTLELRVNIFKRDDVKYIIQFEIEREIINMEKNRLTKRMTKNVVGWEGKESASYRSHCMFMHLCNRPFYYDK